MERGNQKEKPAIEFSHEQLRKMQLLQLEMLKEFDRICRKNSLKYTLSGGSMLGAIRHKGFIPWDDDIDVTMLREDYEKFCEVVHAELDTEKYFFQTMDTDPEYRMAFGRILLNGTSFIRVGQEHMKSKTGVFIDVFPRDGLSDIMPIRLIQNSLGFLMRKMLYSPVGVVKSTKRINRLMFWILSKFPRRFDWLLLEIIKGLNFGKNTERVACYGLMDINEKKRMDMSRAEYRAYKRNLRNESKEEKMARRDRNKGLKRVYFEEVVDMPFEDMIAQVSKHYDAWLKRNYDDYMTLPPANKRAMHHTVSSVVIDNRDI